MTDALSAQTVRAMAALAGHPLEDGAAERIAQAIGPALDIFARVEATLPFEAEPSGFVSAQRAPGESA